MKNDLFESARKIAYEFLEHSKNRSDSGFPLPDTYVDLNGNTVDNCTFVKVVDLRELAQAVAKEESTVKEVQGDRKWTHNKPTEPGAYWFKAEDLGVEASLVKVVRIDDDLWCNLQMRNTDDADISLYGYEIDTLSPEFEFLGPLS